MSRYQFRLAGMVILILALTIFAAAAGVFVRDIGAGTSSSSNAPLGPFEGTEIRFYAYELTYDLAIFSTVEVSITIEAMFSDWSLEFQSNGSFVTPFRPELPGIHRVLVTSLEERTGQVGVSILQLSDLPPELETSLLDPMLLATAVLLAASVLAFLLAGRGESKGRR